MARRRAQIKGLVVALLLVGGAVLGWRPISALLGEGSTRAEAWCGRQLVAIAADHLGPTLVLGAVDYQYPRTVTIDGLRLESDGVAIIEAVSARIEFARIPRPGQPILIKAIDLYEPVVRVIEREDGSVLGYHGFVRSSAGRELTDGGSTRLTDVLAVTRATVHGGVFEYSRAGEGTMRLEPITFELLREASKEADEGGWYGFDAELAFDPIAEVNASIRLNPNTAVIDVTSAELHVTIDPERYEVFPPQIQTLLRAHAISGSLTASCDGVVPLGDPIHSLLRFKTKLTQATVSFDQYVLPINVLSAQGRASGGLMEIESGTLDALGGQAQFWARQWLDGPGRPFHVRATASNLLLEEAMQNDPTSDKGMAGEIGVVAELRGEMDDLPGSLTGGADVSLENGHLGERTTLRSLLAAMSIVPVDDTGDRGHGRFVAAGDHVRLEDLQLIVNRFGVKGDGDIFYDGRINLHINAGPLERIEGVLGGGLGSILGGVTKRLNVYNITGTLREPQVTIHPLGIGVQKSEASKASEEAE